MATTATPPPVLKLATRVQVAAGTGYVRFVGQTGFAAGKWVGVELDEAGGKNDGSVAGKRYFTCDEGRGVFVRPSQIRLLLEGGEDGRVESPTPSRPQSATSAVAQRPPSRTLTSRPPSVALNRASITSTTTARRPSATAAPSISGRTSVASAASESRAASPSKLVKPAVGPPKLASRLSSSSSASTSNPFRPPSATSFTAPSHARKPSLTSAATSAMPPPPTPSTRALPRPASPRKPSVTAAPTTNFAPPSGGTRLPPPGSASKMTRTLSAQSASSSSSLGSRRASMARSPPPTIMRPAAASMQRQVSAGASSVGESIMGEEPLAAELAEQDDSWAGEGAEVHQVEKQKEDPFSLRQAMEPKKVVEPTVPRREHEELLAKLRIVEARRAEDRERLRDVDRLKEEADEWLKVKEKTKTKIVELVAEIKELKKQNKEIQADRDDVAEKLDDLNDQVEISLLDKEVAEERYEAAEAQLEALKERAAELEIEVGVLREENARLEGEGDAEIARGGDEAKSSLAFIQLEKQNARLKEALLRLRELTSESEAESRRKISDLEKELDLTSDLQSAFDNNVVELERAEAQIDELKSQLDDALGAEDMLEQLTDRNLTLSEKLEEMDAIVEDLEALKELNDELEESHIETEKQMQEELDLKDLQIRDLSQRGDSLEESLADYEATIGQFRELVLSLQADLEQLRQHQASKESESQSLTSQSQAMLNLNLKLQTSVLKGQVKTIDLELRKLDALQASEHLSIMKPYLVPAYFDEDSDAVESLLFFERLAYKADLISMIIEQKHNVSESLNTVVPETLIGVCETRVKLAHFSSLNKRFAAQLKRCEPDVFIKMGQVYREVAPTEKRIDAFIEALRREELREIDCGREIEGFIAQTEHLAEVHLQGSELDLVEREQSCVYTLDLDFDTITAAVGFTKQTLATISKDPDIVLDAGDYDVDDFIFKPLQHLVNQARNAKVVSKKLLRRLADLAEGSSAVNAEHVHGFDTLAYNSSAISMAAAKLASDVLAYCQEVRTSKQPFQVSAFLATAKEVTATELGKDTARPLEEIGALLGQLLQDVSTTLATAMEPAQIVKFTFEAPWLARVAHLQSTAATNVNAERTVVKLNEELRDLVRQLRVKDQSYQESAVKIELMEKRMNAVKKQAEFVTELEGKLARAEKDREAHEQALETVQTDLDAMESEYSKLKQTTAASDKQGSTSAPTIGETISYEGNMETSYLIEQIDSLRGAVRFLRSENSYLKSQDLLAELEQLPSYSSPPPSPPREAAGIPRLNAPPTLSFAARSKILLREARLLSSTPRLVDLSAVKPGGRGGWQPSARTPRNQLAAEKERVRVLGRKVERLWEMRPTMLSV